jgi:hypothetical protein
MVAVGYNPVHVAAERGYTNVDLDRLAELVQHKPSYLLGMSSPLDDCFVCGFAPSRAQGLCVQLGPALVECVLHFSEGQGAFQLGPAALERLPGAVGVGKARGWAYYTNHSSHRLHYMKSSEAQAKISIERITFHT